MTKKVRVGVIGGFGRIGREVRNRVIERGWQVSVIVEISGIYDGGESKYDDRKSKIDELTDRLVYLIGTDMVALCIPTLDDGRTAFEYILPLVKRGIPVVTSEKGALANYYNELSPWLDRIGYSATVGGGTRMLHWLKERICPHTEEVHLVINGTLNYIFDGLSSGRTLDEVVDEAKKLGYAEPGTKRVIDVVNFEATSDAAMKTSIVVNICGLGKVRAKNSNIKRRLISDADLRRLVREANIRRFIVSITKEKNEEDVIGGFHFKLEDGWHVSGGFKNRFQNPLFAHLIPPGVNNAALVYGPEGKYVLSGPGAGITATVMGSMIRDMDTLKG